MLEQTIILLPLLAALVNGLFYKFMNRKLAAIIGSVSVLGSFFISVWVFYNFSLNGQVVHILLFKWLDTGNFSANWAIYIDQLSSIMLLVVTSVSAMVHIYSFGYMEEKDNLPRFMSYLSLFTFAMLMLVVSDNFLQLFFGWEGVGLCSYLLIGYWYKKDSANNAAIKAFVVNRVSDFAFIIGIIAIYWNFGSLEFGYVFNKVQDIIGQEISVFGFNVPLLDLICSLLFIGCMGKSAQIGLHTWLPDAMEGPTPVSALIHAATMVTAGVFLVARCSYIFEYCPNILVMITVIGSITCVFAGTIAIAQDDIKKVIAYSTCSQLGYMFFACGVSAYQAGIMHLFTHAFFKALLFLAAGSVIHALHHEQDMKKMGGIWNKIPFTYSFFVIGSLALMGVYPLAGYFSKDLILESAYASGTSYGHLAYWLGLFAAFLTAGYSARVLYLTFHGTSRLSKKEIEKAHESPITMLLPMGFLAVLAIISGFVAVNILQMDEIEGYFGRSLLNHAHHSLEHAHHVPDLIKLLPSILGISATLIVLIIFSRNYAESIKRGFKYVYNFLSNKYYIDEIYNSLFVKPTDSLAKLSWKGVDVNFIDNGGPNYAANISRMLAGYASRLQTGYMYSYVFYILFAIVATLTWLNYNMIIEIIR